MQRDDERDHEGCRAVLIDPSGPRWLRLLPLGVAGALFVAGVALASAVTPLLVAMGIAVLAGARHVPLFLERFAVGDVRLRFVPGAIEVRGPLLRRTRLAARHVEGASTAPTKNGYRITLRHAARSRPLAIEVRTLGELRAVCRALGIGIRGYGSLAFPARPTPQNVAESVARTLTVLGTIVFVAAWFGGAEDLAQWTTLATALMALFAMAMSIERLYSGPPTLRLDAHAIQLPVTLSYPWVHYEAIESMVPAKKGFVARVRNGTGSYELLLDGYRLPFVPEGMSQLERELFAETVLTAMARARGKGMPLDSHEDATRHLERRADETAAEWLARIDALAQGPQAAYRGNSIRTEDLVRVLEDTDVSPHIRAAAARVLARSPGELRLRVEPVVAAEHDEAARVRIAAAADGRDEEFLRLVAEDEEAAPAARAKLVRH